MEDSCGPSKRKRGSARADIQNLASSNSNEKITGNIQHLHLPYLVVKKILECLDFKGLLLCSLVNKVWNHEARRLLREKYQCVLLFDLELKSPEQIMDFLKTKLNRGLPVPYVGVSIKKLNAEMTWWKPKKFQLARNVVRNFIQRAGPFTVVQLDFCCRLEFVFEVWFTRNVLTEVLQTVNLLNIKNLGRWELFINAKRFPELKKLEVDTSAEINQPDMINLQNSISDSLKLESVGCLSSRLLYLLDTLPSTRKLAVVKEFTCDNMYKYQGAAAKFAELKPQLEKLLIPRNPEHWLDEHGLTVSTSESLLLSSQASLIDLRATYEILQETHRKKPWTSFVNLRCLTVDIPWDMEREGLDHDVIFTALFPKLERLEINREDHCPPDTNEYLYV